MNGQAKSVRLCVVFVLSGVLTVMCLIRMGLVIPPSISHYLDIIMALMMVVLLLCVLELCLGVELCSCACCGQERERDPERVDSTQPATALSESPPSYDVIMAGGTSETHSGTATETRERDRPRESWPLKQDFTFRYKPSGDDDGYLPMRSNSFMTPGELWLAVDGLPTYEEAVARLREEDIGEETQEGSSTTRTQHQQEEEVRQGMVERITEESPRQQEGQVPTRLQHHQQEEEEETMATLQEEEVSQLEGERDEEIPGEQEIGGQPEDQ